jgi:hypothetical protein
MNTMVIIFLSFRYKIDISFYAFIVAIQAIILGLSICCPPHEFVYWNFLLVISRMVLLVVYILIMMSLYEYYARFALSLAQSCFDFVIALVVIYMMYEAKKEDIVMVKTKIEWLWNQNMNTMSIKAHIHVNDRLKYSLEKDVNELTYRTSISQGADGNIKIFTGLISKLCKVDVIGKGYDNIPFTVAIQVEKKSNGDAYAIVQLDEKSTNLAQGTLIGNSITLEINVMKRSTL